MDDPWKVQLKALGSFIRSQRELARLSLRELSDRTKVSNPYLSQIERGLHEPSIRVLKAIAEALDVSAETLLAHAGLLEDEDAAGEDGGERPAVESAIRADPVRSDAPTDALIAVYRSFIADDSS